MDQNSLLKFSEIIFHPFLAYMCNYYIILYYKGPPDFGWGERLETPNHEKQIATNY